MNFGTTGVESRRILYRFFVFFFVLVLGIGAAGSFIYDSQKEHIKQEKQNELSAVADLKVNTISWWIKERLGDAAVVGNNQLIGREVEQWLKHPEESPHKANILTWIETLQKNYDYRAVSIVDPQGSVLLSFPEQEKLDPYLLEHLRQSMRLKEAVLSNLHRCQAQNEVCLSVFSPILNRAERDAPVVAVFFLQIDPDKFLNPLVQSWPTPSRTSETLLVRREGDDVVFLNELRHKKDTALSLRFPLSTAKLPSAMAVLGQEGVVEGVDYRGVPVFAAMRAIPDSPWFLLAKIDTEEMYLPIHERALSILYLASLLIVIAGVGLALLWSHQHRQALQKARDELEMRVRERTVELERANESLQSQITRREEAEKDLFEKSRFLEAFFEHSITPLVFLDKDFNFVRVNEAYARACQRDVSEFPGHNHFRLYPSDTKKIFQEVVETKQLFRVAARPFVFPDHPEWGVTYWDWTLVPILGSEGNIDFLVFSLNDVTERHLAQEEIIRAKALLQSVFDGISDPLLLVEKNFTVRMLNEASCRYFQVNAREEAIGKTCYELALKKCPSCDNCVASPAVLEGKSITFERRGIFDPERVEQITVYPVDEAIGGVSGVIVRISDITESKNMEKHLMQVDRLSSLGLVAGGIAHEIRNPLQGVNLFVDVLSDEEKFHRTAQELDIFQEMKINIKKIDEIIRRVLDFSRQSVTTSQKLKIGVLIEESLQLWRTKLMKSGITIRLSVEENLPEVFGDPIEIQQVLTNLVQNAVEAMENGGTLSIGAQNGTLPFDSKREAVIIKVQDSGPGIPADQQQNIFNPFFTTKHTGTGLGLVISHRIISRHGGLLSFSSSPSVGTTFTVELPASRESGDRQI